MLHILHIVTDHIAKILWEVLVLPLATIHVRKLIFLLKLNANRYVSVAVCFKPLEPPPEIVFIWRER